MQALRDFWRFHFIKLLLVLVGLQLAVVGWLQIRNNSPVIVNDEVRVIEGRDIKIQPLRNDLDKDEEDQDKIKIFDVGSAISGEVIVENDYLIYKAKYGFTGVDSFTYIITDGDKTSKPGYIKMLVEKNNKPTANNDYVQMYLEKLISFSPLLNDVDAENDSVFVSSFSQPMYGKIEKTGNSFSYIPDNLRVLVDSFTYTISDGFNSSEKATVLIDLKDKSYRIYPWLNADVGGVELEGNVQIKSGNFNVQASGSDIWGSNDSFNYTYRLWEGDCEITLKVNEQEDTHEWAKAGIMIREDLSGSAKNVFAAITSKHGLGFQCRSQAGRHSEELGGKKGVNTPCWLKLQRNGNEFVAKTSSDGVNWEEYGQGKLDLPNEVYVGIASTSHDNSKLGHSNFTKVKVK